MKVVALRYCSTGIEEILMEFVSYFYESGCGSGSLSQKTSRVCYIRERSIFLDIFGNSEILFFYLFFGFFSKNCGQCMTDRCFHFVSTWRRDAASHSNATDWNTTGKHNRQLNMSSKKSESKNTGKRKRDVGAGPDEGATSKHKGDGKTTLGSLLKYMEGYEIIVELKTGKRHRGRLLSADDNMNLMLEEQVEDQDDVQSNTKGIRSGDALAATETTAQSDSIIPLTRNIRGSKVRYIHFPDNANLPMLVRSGRERERNAAKRYQKTKRSRK